MSRPINVLMVAIYPENPNDLNGGVEGATVSLCDGLSKRDEIARLVVASVHTGPRPSSVVQIGEKLEVRHIRVPFLSGDSLVRSYPSVVSVRRSTVDFIPDLVHGQGVNRIGDVAISMGKPSVVTVHGLVHMEARLSERNAMSAVKEYSALRMLKRVVRRADRVISISKYDQEIVAQYMRGHTRIIPNAVDAIFFGTNRINPGRPTLLYAGLLRERKNIIGILEAFEICKRTVPDAELKIAGKPVSDEYFAEIRSKIGALDLGGSVRFLGNISAERLSEEMSSSDGLVLFSVQETLPLVIAQAMAAGLPVISSNVGGVREMITEGETGYLVPAGDVGRLAERMAMLLKEPESGKRMGDAAATFARATWLPEVIVSQTIDEYYSTISNRSGR